MALVDQIKARMFRAMKAGNAVEKEILKVAIGEITTDAARPGKKGDDAEALAILKKLVKSNEKTIALSENEAQKQTLLAEIEAFLAFFPPTLPVPDILPPLPPLPQSRKPAANAP